MKIVTRPVTSSRRKKAPARRRGRLLPDDACPTCGAWMKERQGRLGQIVNGEEIVVSSSAHLRCPECGEIVLRFTDAKRLQEDAIGIYRKRHGLLSAAEIKAIRVHFGLTQADLAHLLRLGANTVSRWEAGRNVQTASLDVLLRLLRDVPGSIDYLRGQAA